MLPYLPKFMKRNKSNTGFLGEIVIISCFWFQSSCLNGDVEIDLEAERTLPRTKVVK